MRSCSILLIVTACASAAVPPTRSAPVETKLPAPTATLTDAEPGLRLSYDLRPTGYRALLRLDPAQSTFTATIEIDAELSRPSQTLWLHGHRLSIAEATATQGDRTIALTTTLHDDDRLALRAPQRLPTGAWTLRLRYTGVIDDQESHGAFRRQERGDWYAFSDFEPLAARRVFPCVDEPDRKVSWQLTLEVPAALTALANTRPEQEEIADPGWKRIRFAPTRPLPSYLIAFAVGPFDLVEAGTSRSGIPLRVAAFRGQSRRAKLAAELLPKSLAFLEDYLGMAYPFDKIDLVPVPAVVGFGAMENAGLITFESTLLLFEPSGQTRAERRLLGEFLGHELAHQWFGNIVTAAWWDDIWLNEGLATWIEESTVKAIDPSWDTAVAAYRRRDRALRSDSVVAARAVRQPITVEDDILTVFDGITYAKAGSVMAMIEHWVGPERFREGVQQYLKAHAFGNASAADFLSAIAKAAGRDLSGVATLLDRPGIPLLAMDLECDGARAKLTITQSRYQPAGAPEVKPQRWTLPVCVAYDRDGQRAEACAQISDERASLDLDAKRCPHWVAPNAEAVGYYRTALSSALTQRVLEAGWPAITHVERATFVDDLWSRVQHGDVALADAVALVPRLLADGTRPTFEVAMKLTQLDAVVPPAHQAAYDHWIMKTFGPLARRLGWTRRASDDIDTEYIRRAVVPRVARAGDRALRIEARRLAARWRTLARDDRDPVLFIAARDNAIFDQLYQDAVIEPERETRIALVRALAGNQDPERVRRLFALYLDDRMDPRELFYLPRAINEAPQRAAGTAFVREHIDELTTRIPPSGLAEGVAVFAGLFTDACDPARRDEIAAFVTERLIPAPHSRPMVVQAIERMDQCIAWRAVAAPQLERWLAPKRHAP